MGSFRRLTSSHSQFCLAVCLQLNGSFLSEKKMGKWQAPSGIIHSSGFQFTEEIGKNNVSIERTGCFGLFSTVVLAAFLQLPG